MIGLFVFERHGGAMFPDCFLGEFESLEKAMEYITQHPVRISLSVSLDMPDGTQSDFFDPVFQVVKFTGGKATVLWESE